MANKAQLGSELDSVFEGDRVTTFNNIWSGPLLWLPLPGSPADMTATVFFLGLLGLIAWQIYHSSAK